MTDSGAPGNEESQPSIIPQVEVPNPRPAVRPGDRVWFWVLLVFFLGLLGAWLWLTPPGFFGKLQALGYSVCHQIDARSFHSHLQKFPLCARCTGMYLGAMVALAFQFSQGRKGKFPAIWQLIVLGFFLLAFAVDGSNSFLKFIPGIGTLYEPSNLLRLVTGLGVGLGIGAVLFPVFHQTIWFHWENTSALHPWQKFLALVVLELLAGLAVLSGLPALQYPAMIISSLGVYVLLTLVYTLVSVLLLRRDGSYSRWAELKLPLLMGMTLALLQISAISILRFWFTHSWGPINL